LFPMTMRRFPNGNRKCGLSALLMLGAVLFPVWGSAEPKPNIILILVDDMGWNDLGAYTYPNKASPGPPPATGSGGAGTTDVPPPNPAYDAEAPSTSITPRIDSLGDDGVRMTRFYSTHPVCTPTRASLMTGGYATRVRLERVVGPYQNATQAEKGLNSTEVTLPELLRSAGYQTGMSGKWHLGHEPDFNPLRHGFESYFGILYSNDMWGPNLRENWVQPLHLMRGELALNSYTTDTGKTVQGEIDTDAEQSFLLEALTDEAVDFIDASVSEGRPFFLYYAPHAPHVPIHPHPDFLSTAGQTDAIARYYDLIREIDARVGEILDRLDHHGIANDTLIVFTSDNGPSQHSGRVQAGEVPGGGGSAYPFRGSKRETQEGGHRVPLLARQSGTLPAGTVLHQTAATFDLYTTLAKMAGADLPVGRSLDGTDLGPLLQGTTTDEPHAAFYFYASGQSTAEAVADLTGTDKWKYTERSGSSGELFRLGEAFTGDFQESTDVSGTHAAIKTSLNAQLATWNRSMTRREAGWVRPVRIEVEQDRVVVDEDGNASTRIRLSGPATKTIHVERFSGDTSLDVSQGATLNFTTGDWDIWQTVTFSFSPDLDTEDGAAVFRAYGNSMTSSSDIHVREIFVFENDTMQAVTQLPPPDNPLQLRYTLNESAGTAITDGSSQNNNGTLTGSTATSWGAGKLGGSLHFDGSAIAYVEFASALVATNATGLSASAWVKLSEYGSGENRWILQQLNGGGTGRTWLAVMPDGQLATYVGGTETRGGSISLNQWHHVAVTAGSGTVHLYLDGVQVASNSVSVEDNTAGFRIGNHKTLDLAKQWKGGIDDLRVFSGVLEKKEIEWLAAHSGFDLNIGLSLEVVGGKLHLSITYRQLSGGSGNVGADYEMDGTTWTVETNTDLGSIWNSGTGFTLQVGSATPVDEVNEEVKVRLKTPVSEADTQFLRMKVEEKP